MDRSRAHVCWVLVLLAAAVGCGDDPSSPAEDAGAADPVFDAGSDDARNAVQPGELCERLSTVQCAGEAYCCGEPGRSYAQCKKELLAACEDEAHLDEIAISSVTGFDAARAEAAFAGFEKLAKKCDPSIAAWGASVDGLRGMLQGKVEAGGSCAPRGAPTDKTVAAAALASCLEPETHACQPRATRLSGVLDWTCDEKGTEGGTCFSDYNCNDGLFCDNPKQRLGAKCQVRRADGDACTFGTQCISLFCQDELCVPAERQAAYCLKLEPAAP